jgi:hypothetical protein
MAHFAVLNDRDVVVGVYGVANAQITDSSGSENEELGKAFICNLLKIDDTSRVVQTSYNKSFRGAFAGIGMMYDRNRDVFLLPKRFPSWVYDETSKSYIPPQEQPNDGGDYIWDEANGRWIPIGISGDGATLFEL